VTLVLPDRVSLAHAQVIAPISRGSPRAQFDSFDPMMKIVHQPRNYTLCDDGIEILNFVASTM
jgi:hypothetical protein